MLRNLTKNTIISDEIKKSKGLSKTLGLMGKDKPEAIILNTSFGIHTFFLKFPIDVMILDKKNKVVSLKNGLKPNKIFFWNFKYNTVIELADKSITKSKTELGDILDIKL